MKYEIVHTENSIYEIRMPISDDGYSLCPVCGDKSKNKDFRPYDKLGYPSYGICQCCGIEFGFDCEPDSTELDWRNYRAKWLRNEIDLSMARKMSKADKLTQLRQIEVEE